MALKDIWVDLEDATDGIAGSGDEITVKPINNIAHSVIKNESNIETNNNKIIQLEQELQNIDEKYNTETSSIRNIAEDNRMRLDEVESNIGNIEDALDNIIAIQNTLIGGDA